MQTDAAVEGFKRQFRPALAGAAHHHAVRTVNEPPVPAVGARRRDRERRYIEIRINAAIELLEMQICVQPGLEVEMELPVKNGGAVVTETG